MAQKYTDADGNEVETLSPDEAKQLQEERDNLAKEKEDLAKEKERLEAGGNDKDENFRKMRASMEEKDKKLDEITKRLNDKEEYERTSTKEAIFKHYAGEDADARKKLEEEYGFITGIDESTPERIAERATKAAKVSGLYKEEGGSNPVFKGIWSGGAPVLKPQKSNDDADNILNTDKGKSALNAMGVPTEEKK